MKVSFLIVFHNGIKFAQACIDSIISQNSYNTEIEIIAIDNASSDGTPDLIRKYYPQVNLVALSKNVGFSVGNNIAYENSHGDIICCVNQDVILSENWLTAGLTALKQSPDAVACATNMIMPWVMSRNTFLNIQSYEPPIAYLYSINVFGYASYTSVINHTPHYTNFVSGGAFLILRQFIDDEPFLFDPRIFMYSEDLDLSLRIQARGVNIVYSKNSWLFHDQAPIGGSIQKQLTKFIMATKNRMVVLSRRLGVKRFLTQFPLFLIGVFMKNWSLDMPLWKKFASIPISLFTIFIVVIAIPYWGISALTETKRTL